MKCSVTIWMMLWKRSSRGNSRSMCKVEVCSIHSVFLNVTSVSCKNVSVQFPHTDIPVQNDSTFCSASNIRPVVLVSDGKKDGMKVQRVGEEGSDRFWSHLSDPSSQMASCRIVEMMTPPLYMVPDDVQTFSVGCAISYYSSRTKGFLFIQVIQWMGLCGQM